MKNFEILQEIDFDNPHANCVLMVWVELKCFKGAVTLKIKFSLVWAFQYGFCKATRVQRRSEKNSETQNQAVLKWCRSGRAAEFFSDFQLWALAVLQSLELKLYFEFDFSRRRPIVKSRQPIVARVRYVYYPPGLEVKIPQKWQPTL